VKLASALRANISVQALWIIVFPVLTCIAPSATAPVSPRDLTDDTPKEEEMKRKSNSKDR